MPVSLVKEINNSKLGLWILNEAFDVIYKKFIAIAPENEIKKVDKFKFEKRKQEWIATRLLVFNILGEYRVIKYDEFGKPHIDDVNISISHTKSLVAVIIGNKEVGVDVEKVSERILRIAPKFLFPAEIDSVEINNQLLKLHAYWCAKETIYKIYGKRKLDFKNNIKIETFKIKDKGQIKGAIKFNDFNENYTLNYFIHKEDNITEDFIVVYYC